MLTVARGNESEAAVLTALIGAGYSVLTPFGDGHPYDLVVGVGQDFLRVQCKTAWAEGGCLIFNAYSTDHGRGPGSYVGLADLFGVFFPANRTVYLVPVAEFKSQGRLRLSPTRNNQKRGVRFAADYEISRWTPERFAAL